jgi:hypothetical protein
MKLVTLVLIEMKFDLMEIKCAGICEGSDCLSKKAEYFNISAKTYETKQGNEEQKEDYNA